jgi:hypothetical protein
VDYEAAFSMLWEEAESNAGSLAGAGKFEEAAMAFGASTARL